MIFVNISNDDDDFKPITLECMNGFHTCNNSNSLDSTLSDTCIHFSLVTQNLTRFSFFLCLVLSSHHDPVRIRHPPKGLVINYGEGGATKWENRESETFCATPSRQGKTFRAPLLKSGNFTRPPLYGMWLKLQATA